MDTKKVQRQKGDPTRKKILKAALQLFSEKGYSATSLSQIATLAQINQSLIAHHFGNKEKLFQQVKKSTIPQKLIMPISQAPASLHAFLNEVIQQRLTLYENSPALYRLVSWEKMESTEKRRKLVGMHESAVDPFQWIPAIEYLQSKNKINKQLKPILILIWIIYSVNAILVNDIGILKKHSDSYQAYLAMLTSGLERGLQP